MRRIRTRFTKVSFLFPLALTGIVAACANDDRPSPEARIGTARSALSPSVGTWTAFSNTPPPNPGLALLMTDGTVLVSSPSESAQWSRLTPDSSGSYVNGTWSSSTASMHDSRLYFASAVLADGRLFVAGGEYGTGQSSAEIYDPRQNAWASIPAPGVPISDATGMTLPDGRLMLFPASQAGTLIYDPTAGSWRSPMIPKAFGDFNEEESFSKLPDGSILGVDGSNATPLTQKYVPASGGWVSAGTLPAPLFSGNEIGPGVLLYDGRAFFLGANGNTALYTQPANPLDPGTWVQGPSIPNGQVVDDAPAAVMPNGRVLFMAEGSLTGTVSFYEYDPVSNTYASAPLPPTTFAFPTLLVLPTGQVLLSGATGAFIYTPSGGPSPSWKPTIASVTDHGNGSYLVQGGYLNGWTEGAYFGDDAQSATNYPLVRLVDGGGIVRYGRTFGFSSLGVAVPTGSFSFTVPGIPAGAYTLSVVTNGIASDPVSFTVLPSAVPCNDGVKDGNETDVDCGGSCTACSPGQACAGATDCTTGDCVAGVCVPGCADGVLDPGETDVDCGGTACGGCSPQQHCNAGGDCLSQVCVSGVCQAPTCTDHVKNGTETDVDCGGSCAGCAVGQQCLGISDCGSRWGCTAGVCEAPTCNDEIRNGNETDVDCGGGTCAPCADGKLCVVGSDCQSNTCMVVSGSTFRCGTPISVVGSQDLANVTIDMTSKTSDPRSPVCLQSLGISYSGGPVSYGESAMLSGAQQIAPMSTFLDSAVCSASGAAGSPGTAEGLVFGLNALSVLGAQSTAGASACNGSTADCDPTTDPTAGLAWNTTVQRPTKGAYTFNGWQDVLRILYGGVSRDPNDTGCDSEIRTFLANNWSSVFESAGCTSGSCTQIQHLFRPDDGSEGSVVFASLLGLTPVPSASALNGFGKSPFCNALNWDDTSDNNSPATGRYCTAGAGRQFVGPGGIPQGVCPGTSPAVLCSPVGAAGICPSNVGCSNVNQPCADGSGTCQALCPDGSACVAYDGIHRRPPLATWGDVSAAPPNRTIGADVMPTSYQDNDPIRRPCVGGRNITNAPSAPAEEVCNLDGTLGLVLPIPSLDFVAAPPNSQNPFPTAKCTAWATGGMMNVAKCPVGPTPIFNLACPDGAKPYGGSCQVPVAGQPSNGGTALCENDPSRWPPSDGTNRDGRIFNLTLYSPSGVYLAAPAVTPGGSAHFAFTGAFARIHQSRTLWNTQGGTVPQPNAPCTYANATDQISCLAQASPCSFALGIDGSTSQAGVSALKVDALDPTSTCISNVQYPLWRKEYLNTLVGFPALTGSQLGLAECESSGRANSALERYGFMPVTGSPNGGPFCEDFDEQTQCGAPSNTNACAGNVGDGGLPFPTFSTTCGNGVVEPLEQCDNGAANGPPPAACSRICRTNPQ